MLTRLRRAGLLWPTVMTLVALPILIGLGTWQLQRKTWKEGLISRLVARSKAPPVSLAEAAAQLARTHDVEYLRVRVRGTFDHAAERYLYSPDSVMGPGWHVYTPLTPTDGSAAVMVNRGFVPEQFKEPAQRAAGQVAGQTEVVGLLRSSEEPGRFTPRNDVARNQWFWRDVLALRTSAGLPAATDLPFAIDADAVPANPGGWPKGGTTIINLPNRHLEYALTWYGLAAALMVIYATFAFGRLKAADQGA